MAFLFTSDLISTLNTEDIGILSKDDKQTQQAINKAIGKVKGYIQHRYDPDEIFINITLYSSSTAYAVGDYVYNGSDKIYTCILASTGNALTNTTYFTEGDPRDPSIVDIVSIIAIYYLFRKIQPRVVPDWIAESFEEAKEDLTGYGKGTRTIILPVQTDADGEEEGHRISYGSEGQKNWNF